MSEKQKATEKSLDQRVKEYFLMKDALAAKYESLKDEIAEVHDPNAKHQVYSGFSYTPAGSLLDEAMLINAYLLEHKEEEYRMMDIQSLEATMKREKDSLISDACAWFTSQGLEMPKKPRAASFRLNKGGMKDE